MSSLLVIIEFAVAEKILIDNFTWHKVIFSCLSEKEKKEILSWGVGGHKRHKTHFKMRNLFGVVYNELCSHFPFSQVCLVRT